MEAPEPDVELQQPLLRQKHFFTWLEHTPMLLDNMKQLNPDL